MLLRLIQNQFCPNYKKIVTPNVLIFLVKVACPEKIQQTLTNPRIFSAKRCQNARATPPERFLDAQRGAAIMRA